MILFWQNHRLGQKPEFVFQGVGKPENVPAESKTPELPEVETVKSAFAEFAAMQNMDLTKEEWPRIEKAADQWAEENYGQEKMRQDLAKELKISPDSVNLSKKAKEDLESLKVEFIKSLKKNYDNAKGLEEDKINEARVAEKSAELDLAIANPEGKGKVEKAILNGYIPALNAKYVNLDWQEKILKKNDFAQYKTLAESFKDNVRENTKGRLESVYMRFAETKDAGPLKADLEAIRNDIAESYKTLANPEGFIDLGQLKAVAKKASENVNFARTLRDTENKEEMLKIMDARDFFARKESIVASKEMGERISRRAEREGAETNFIKAVQLHTQKSVANFEDARIVFSQELETNTQISFRKGFELAEAVGQDTFEGLEEPIGMESQTPAFKAMVERERTNFIIGSYHLENVDDVRLQAFMRLNTRDEREEALLNPTESAALFKSISTIKARENTAEGKEWRDKLPKKTDTLRASHVLVARHMAIVGLAKEADYLIKNLTTTEALKNKGVENRYMAAIDSPDPNPAPTDYKFKDNFKRSRARYVSEVERAGFNRRDIGFALLQTWGVITFLLNAKQSWKGWKKIPDMLGKMAKNPFIYLSGGAVLGPHSIKQDPESLGYLTQSKGGQERIAQHWKLNSISDRVGYTSLKNFINGQEIAAMESLYQTDPKRTQLEKALSKAESRSWRKPVLEKEDLVGVVGESARSNLPGPEREQGRIRYLFYKKLLTDPKVNLEQLLKNCRNWQGPSD